MSAPLRRPQPNHSLFGSATSPPGKHPQGVPISSSPEPFYDFLDMPGSYLEETSPKTKDQFKELCFFELPDQAPSRRFEPANEVQTHPPPVLKILRSRTLVWQTSACRRRISTKRYKNTAERVATFWENCGVLWPETDYLTAYLGPLSSLITSTPGPRSVEPDFRVVVPTSQALTKQLTLRDCPEIIAASPFLGLHLLCKRLDLSSFDPWLAPNPLIKVPLPVIEYIEGRLHGEDFTSANLEDWIVSTSKTKWKNIALSLTPILDMLDHLDHPLLLKDRAVWVQKDALEELAMKLAGIWPERAPQDEQEDDWKMIYR